MPSIPTQSLHVDEAVSVGVYGLVVGEDVEQHMCQYTSLWYSISLSSPTALLPVQHHEEASAFQHSAYQVGYVYVTSQLWHLVEEASVVDRVVGSTQFHEDRTGDQSLLVAIFEVPRQVQ